MANRHMEAKYVALLGKMIAKYGAMSHLLDYSPDERDLLRLAKTEYDFYHAHERYEAGSDIGTYRAPERAPDSAPIVEQKPGPEPAVARAKLSLKPTR